MIEPKVTVLTTVYNGLPYLKEAIDSTLDQTYGNFKYLIIDDASPDPEVVKFIEKYDDPRIQLEVNEKNLGVSDTFNKAMTMIDTPYVVRVDQDDVNLPTRIEDQINFLDENQDLSIVCSWEHTIDENGKKGHDWKNKIENYGDFLAPIFLTLSPIWHPSIAFRKDALVDIGGFKREYTRAEDFDVTARLALWRHSAAIIPKFHLLQRQHSKSQSKEFAKEQLKVCYQVQEELIQHFLDEKKALEIASFFRIEGPRNDKFSKPILLNLNKILNELFIQVKDKQKMTDEEMESFKSVIYKRIGLGLKYSNYYSLLPSVLFTSLFYILSPLYFNKLYKVFSYLYNRFNLVRLRIRP